MERSFIKYTPIDQKYLLIQSEHIDGIDVHNGNSRQIYDEEKLRRHIKISSLWDFQFPFPY